MNKSIFICLAAVSLVLGGCAWFSGASTQPPQVYKPNYVYGDTPMGVYMGNPSDVGDDMMDDGLYMPDGQPMGEYQAQSGQPEQQFQYIQGQEALMADQSKEKLQQYNQSMKLSESMDKEYQEQINRQAHAESQSPIVLPNIN